jgi:hypothetical protein
MIEESFVEKLRRIVREKNEVRRNLVCGRKKEFKH